MSYLKNDHFQKIINNNLKTTNLEIKRISSNAVKFNCDEYSGTIYVNTIIYLFDKTTRKITVSNGGWKTNTTKNYLNNSLLGPINIYQKKFVWYISKSGTDYEWKEGTNIDDFIYII